MLQSGKREPAAGLDFSDHRCIVQVVAGTNYKLGLQLANDKEKKVEEYEATVFGTVLRMCSCTGRELKQISLDFNPYRSYASGQQHDVERFRKRNMKHDVGLKFA